MLTNASATIFQRGISSGQETWTRRVIPAVQWENAPAANIARFGMLEADSVTVYIPNSPAAPNINPGDIVVRGVVPNEISALYTITDMLEEFTTNFRVKRVDDFRFGSMPLQHLEVRGS